jgi:hypothetical protein
MKAREVPNTSFALYCRSKGIEPPGQYRKVQPNMAASLSSASKYDKVQPFVDEAAFLLSGEWTKNHFKPFMGGSGVVSEELALAEMDKTTSAGYPWNLTFMNKTEFLEDPVARRVLSEYWERISLPNNKIVPIWTCSQKVELRPVEKILLNKIRTFTAAPVEHTVCANRLFLDMNNRFYRNANRTWSVVGMSKFLRGWDNLYHRLDVHPNAFALDESEYDSSLFARIMRECGEIRYSFLAHDYRTSENLERVAQIYDAIVNSVVLLENGDLVQKHTGNPSGSSNTIVDNTICLFRLKAYAWIRRCEKLGFEASYATFISFVEAALCGDDNTFTVSDEVVAWFNARSISEEWSLLGITTTSDNYASRKLSDVDFLSQGFRYDEKLEIWMPVPDTNKILCSVMWGSSVDDVRWHLLRACALRMDSYGNLECRKTLDEYIDFLNTRYSEQMSGSIQVGRSLNIPMKLIRTVWKSDTFLDALYSGRESGGLHKDLYTTLKEVDLIIDLEYTMGKSGIKKGATKNSGHKTKAKSMEILKSLTKPSQAPAGLKKAIQAVAKAEARKAEAKGYAPGLLGGIGGAVGSWFGGSTGSGLGSSVGNWLGKITGMGAYKVRSNTLMGGNVPTFGSGAGCTMCHREYLGDVTGSVAFTNTTYNLNPGLTGTTTGSGSQNGMFPWLSLCAAQFEEYQLLGMMIEFKSTSAVALNSTNTALGTVILATDYDTYDTAFTNKQQMEAYEFSSSAPPSQSQLHPIECDPKKNVMQNLYIRSAANPTGSDLRFYDVGVFQLATVGMQAAAVIGELWVTYHVKFMKPKLPTPIGQNLLCARYPGTASTTAGGLGNTIVATGSTVVCGRTGNTVTGIPAGRWLAVFQAVSTVASGTLITSAWVPAASTNCTAVAVYSTPLGTTQSSVNALDNNNCIAPLVFDCTGNGTITCLGLVASSTTGLSVCVQLSQISSGLTLMEGTKTLSERVEELEQMMKLSTPLSTPCNEVEELTQSVHLSREEVRRLLSK